MSETVNAVVNNLSDRLGDVVEAVGPVVETVVAISTTVVQETAFSGFTYTMFGLVFLGIAGLFCVRLAKELHRNREKNEDACTFFGICIVWSFLVGLITTMCNVANWLAPTKAVIREVVRNL